MSNFYQGTSVRIRATFEDADHVVTDPTTITGKFSTPAGVTTTYVYGTNAELVKEATGIYYFDINLNAPRVWNFRFEGTGTVRAASQGSLTCIAANPA